MRRALYLFFFLIAATCLFGQEIYTASGQRMLLLNNPAAFAGNPGQRVASGTMQVAGGIEGLPSSYFVSWEDSYGPFGGGYNVQMVVDRAGMIKTDQLYVNYNRPIFYEDLKWGVGLGLGVRRIDTERIKLEEPGDPILSSTARMYPDLSVGLQWYHNQHLTRDTNPLHVIPSTQLGMSITHINSPVISFADKSERLSPTFKTSLILGDRMFRPYLAVRHDLIDSDWRDISVDYGIDLWFPIGYYGRGSNNRRIAENIYGVHANYWKFNFATYMSRKEAVLVKFALQHRELEMAYYFTYPINEMNTVINGTHEFVFMWSFDPEDIHFKPCCEDIRY